MKTTKWVIEVPHTIGKASLHDFTDGYKSAVIDQANKGDGLPDDSDAALLEYAGRDLHALIDFASDDALVEYAAANEARGWGRIHKGYEIARTIAQAANHDDDLAAAMKSNARAFLLHWDPKVLANDSNETKRAREIILRHVSDWDPEVLDEAAAAAILGTPPHEFEGHPHDADEFAAFCKAFQEIRA